MDKIDTSTINEKIDFNDYINSLLKELKNDDEVYSLIREQNMTVKEVKDNISHLMEFKEDHNYCKNCPGVGKCAKKLPHFTTSIRFDKKIQYLYLNKTACSKYMDKIKIESYYDRFDAPEDWKGVRLQDLDLSSVRRPVVKRFIEGLNKDSFAEWIFLTGNRKCGKSIMLSAFATEFAMKKNKQISFVNSANMIKELSAIVFNDKEEFVDRMTILSETPLLVLDGFGNEVVSEFTRDNIMFPLLTARSDLGLPTFFASDLEFDEIKSLYSTGKNNGEIRGKQMMSLIKGNCGEIYDITGISYKK